MKDIKTQVDKKSIISLAIIVLVFLLIWPLFQKKLIEKPLPAVTLEPIQGSTIDLVENTKPSILFFWATWCEICKVQMPDMLRLQSQYNVIYISADSGSNEKVLTEASKHGLDASSQLVNDPTGVIKDAFGVIGYPSLAVVQNQQIRFFKVGYMRQDEIDSILNELESSS